MKYLPAVALTIGAAALGGAGYFYYLASQVRGSKRRRALYLGLGILLTLVAALQPVLAFDSVRTLIRRRPRGSFVKAAGNNGLTVPGATLFT